MRSPALDAASSARLHRRLSTWYRKHRRDLPWRRDADPYRVWVSEVMLQQTRVETATPFYQRFLERFPTLESLARSRIDDVLAAWAGLGYYRRARQLHAAAGEVLRDHSGRIPDDPERFGRLPGVGRYTTGAVLSIAFDRPLPVLDGNVARVLSRLFGVPASVRDPRGAKALWHIAETLVPMRRPGEWNQALMELGARVCTHLTPRCEACPVRDDCRALATGRVGELPPATRRRAQERVRRAVVIVRRGDRILMARRRGTLLRDLWEPPGIELGAGVLVRQGLHHRLRELGVRARLVTTNEIVRHVITHRAIEVELWRGEIVHGKPRRGAARWVEPGTRDVAITALARKIGERSAR